MKKRYCDNCGKEIVGAAYEVTLDAHVDEVCGNKRAAIGEYSLQLDYCPDCINKTARTADNLEKNIKKSITP